MALFTNMINLSHQRSSACMRPGVGLGGYPQRHDQEPGWGERGLARLWRCRRPLPPFKGSSG